MSRTLTIRFPDKLLAELRDHAHRRGLGVTVAARDLIRRALGSSAFDSGFEEGRIAGWRATVTALHARSSGE